MYNDKHFHASLRYPYASPRDDNLKFQVISVENIINRYRDTCSSFLSLLHSAMRSINIEFQCLAKERSQLSLLSYLAELL